MAGMKSAIAGRPRTGDSYASQWNRFVAWSQSSGKQSLPDFSEDVATYLEARLETSVRPSTLWVAAAAIARNHKVDGFDVTIRYGTARAVLEKLTREEVPGPSRAVPLDLNCYLALRKTAHVPRRKRGGRLKRSESARRRGEVDIAMIGLMRDAGLRVSEAAALTGGDVRHLHGGSGRVRVGGADETEYRKVSADTMRLLLSIRHGAGDDELVLSMRPNQIAARTGAAARQAGLGPG